MKEYHKIQSVFKRETVNKGRIIEGSFSTPEIEFLKDTVWEWTEKVDGTCIRVMLNDGKVSYGGKTDNAQIPANLVQHLRDRFDPQQEKLAAMFPEGVCLYGEGCGPKIQKGGGNYGDVQFVLFDVRVGPWWLTREAVEDVATKLEIPMAPVIGAGTIAEMVEVVRSGITSQWGDFEAEGIVARPKVELFTRAGHRIITKLKTSDFQP
jgi:hypothetical protein